MERSHPIGGRHEFALGSTLVPPTIVAPASEAPKLPTSRDRLDAFLASERPWLLRVAERFSDDELGCEAEDLVADAVLRAYEWLTRSPAPVVSWRRWFFRVLRNLQVDRRRRFSSRSRLREGLRRLVDVEVHCAGTVHPTRRPDRVMYERECVSRTMLHVRELPQGLRQAFALRVMDELDYVQVAKSLAITRAAARKRVQLARERLHRRLEIDARACGEARLALRAARGLVRSSASD